MKVVMFLIITVFLSSNSFTFEKQPEKDGVNQKTKKEQQADHLIKIGPYYPVITGPYTVYTGNFATWEGEDPNENECGSCQWRWDISEESDFSGNTWIGADGPDSNSGMHQFPIGGDIYGITQEDFYLRLVVIENGNYYYSDTILIQVPY